jgi:hypothetical protein
MGPANSEPTPGSRLEPTREEAGDRVRAQGSIQEVASSLYLKTTSRYAHCDSLLRYCATAAPHTVGVCPQPRAVTPSLRLRRNPARATPPGHAVRLRDPNSHPSKQGGAAQPPSPAPQAELGTLPAKR